MLSTPSAAFPTDGVRDLVGQDRLTLIVDDLSGVRLAAHLGQLALPDDLFHLVHARLAIQVSVRLVAVAVAPLEAALHEALGIQYRATSVRSARRPQSSYSSIRSCQVL